MLSEIIDFCLEHADEIKDYEVENYLSWDRKRRKVTFYFEDDSTQIFILD